MENTEVSDEWVEFLYDVREYLKATLEKPEYINTPNNFLSENADNLLSRCEELLIQYSKEGTSFDEGNEYDIMLEDQSYTTMNSISDKQAKQESVIELEVNKHIKSNNEYDINIYDICNVSEDYEDEIKETLCYEIPHLQILLQCPYSELPVENIVNYKCAKQGQLQKIEKRLFFGQFKNYFCVILNDWLLCYVDDCTATQPCCTLNLKSQFIEIDYFGEGKRREICFQISARYPIKKFVFQAKNVLDADEWIHAIKTAISGEPSKVPENSGMADYTYIYEDTTHIHENNENNAQIVPAELSEVFEDKLKLSEIFNYDFPKSPPKILKSSVSFDSLVYSKPKEIITDNQVNEYEGIATEHSIKIMNFQNKLKDVHSQLSSQLAAGPKSPTKGKLSTPITLTKDVKQTKKLKSPKKLNGTNSDSNEKSTKNWFLNRLHKSPKSSKEKNITKEDDFNTNSTSKVNMIINKFEINGTSHILTLKGLSKT